MILPGVVELLLLLSHTAVDLLPDLSQLQLRLQLLFLGLQHAPLFVQGVDGTATLAQLVEKVLDLISQVLVLALNNVKLLNSFLLGSLQAEQLGAVVAAFILGSSNLGSKVGSLGLPLTEHLVEVLGALFSDESGRMYALILHGEVIKIRCKSRFGLLSIGHFGGKNIHQLLIFHDLCLQLVPGHLKLLDAAHTLSFVA